MASQTALLLIEDSSSDARLILEQLRSEGEEFVTVHADSLAAGLVQLSNGGFDVVLLDLSLPDSDGMATFEEVRGRAERVPIVVLTGFDDTGVAEQAVRLGAQDYLVKGRAKRELLVSSIRYAIQRQRVLDALEEARRQQIEAKNRFLSHVSHELRSPLSVILQFVTILLDGLAGEMTPEQRGHLEVVLRNAQQLKAMVDDLLAATRLEHAALPIEVRVVSLVALLEECERAFRPRADRQQVELSCSAARGLSPVIADPDRVREILANLVDNALTFTPPGGRVALGATERADAGEAVVWVADTGRGIASDNLALVFDRFFQERPAAGRGLGLGLYLCRELVTRQGGRIWVESQPGRGSRFSFTLRSSPNPDG